MTGLLDHKNKRSLKDLEDDSPRIILTDADELPPPRTKGGIQDKILKEHREEEIKSLGQVASKLAKHFLITLIVSGLAVLLHFVLKDILGDPRLLDSFPIRYAFDIGDVCVIGTFFAILIRELWDLKE